MRILWIPFMPLSSKSWEGSRHFHFIRRLAKHDIHLLGWDRVGASTTRPALPPSVKIHSTKLLPNIWKLWNRSYPNKYDNLLNQTLMGFYVKRVAKSIKPDVIVLSSTHYATGFFSLPDNVPVLFDHVDEMPDWVANTYFRGATTLAAVSGSLLEKASKILPHSLLIENGVDTARYCKTKRDEAKKKLGLEGKTVVSLIGLTCSKRLYFLEAFQQFSKAKPNSVLLLVGECSFQARVREIDADIRIVGPVAYDNVADYFNATDIGLYPCDDAPYYREAHPLKIVEYSAAGCQVVTSPVDAFSEGWPNVHTSSPDATAFTTNMLKVLQNPADAPSVEYLDWNTKSLQFELLLHKTVASYRT